MENIAFSILCSTHFYLLFQVDLAKQVIFIQRYIGIIQSIYLGIIYILKGTYGAMLQTIRTSGNLYMYIYIYIYIIH